MVREGKGITTEEQKELLLEIHEELIGIYKNRTERYGGTIIHELGLKGRYADIHNKNFRLFSELWEKEPEEWDLDNLYEHSRDLANYATFLMHQIELIRKGEIEKF